MARKPAKNKLCEFDNLMIGGIIALGGLEYDNYGYKWELATIYGKLGISIVPDMYGIHTRFDHIPDVESIGGAEVNQYSGKWNHYRIGMDIPRTAASQLIHILSTIAIDIRYGGSVPA